MTIEKMTNILTILAMATLTFCGLSVLILLIFAIIKGI